VKGIDIEAYAVQATSRVHSWQTFYANIPSIFSLNKADIPDSTHTNIIVTAISTHTDTAGIPSLASAEPIESPASTRRTTSVASAIPTVTGIVEAPQTHIPLAFSVIGSTLALIESKDLAKEVEE
jgi:hypothetical protein